MSFRVVLFILLMVINVACDANKVVVLIYNFSASNCHVLAQIPLQPEYKIGERVFKEGKKITFCDKYHQYSEESITRRVYIALEKNIETCSVNIAYWHVYSAGVLGKSSSAPCEDIKAKNCREIIMESTKIAQSFAEALSNKLKPFKDIGPVKILRNSNEIKKFCSKGKL